MVALCWNDAVVLPQSLLDSKEIHSQPTVTFFTVTPSDGGRQGIALGWSSAVTGPGDAILSAILSASTICTV